MIVYKYTMKGTAADGQSWSTNGEVSVDKPGEFANALAQAQMDSFMQLTNGKAVFGKPGLGCRGPYNIDRFTLEKKGG